MSENAEIFVSKDKDSFNIKVCGRATFAVAPTMRNIIQRIASDNDIRHLSVNLASCDGMDSTFMGILTQLALTCNKMYTEKVKVLNPGEANIKLLHGLGLDRIFNYVTIAEPQIGNWDKEDCSKPSFRDNAETVLNAHKTLIETVPNNAKKFDAVVTQVEKELKNS